MDYDYNWSVIRPSGSWDSVVSNSDGSVLIASNSLLRMYLSIDGGLTWTDPQPSGNMDGDWFCAVNYHGHKARGL